MFLAVMQVIGIINLISCIIKSEKACLIYLLIVTSLIAYTSTKLLQLKLNIILIASYAYENKRVFLTVYLLI